MHRLSSGLFPLTCTPGQVMKWNGSAWSCAADATVGGTPANVFVQGGNAFSADGVLGTIDANRALHVVAGGGRVMRWEPNATSPNVIGGNPANAVAPGVRGAAIAGGGATTEPNFAFPAPNVVTDAYGTVAGGYGNRAGDGTGSVLDAAFATVGGGLGNAAAGESSTIGGGVRNVAAGRSSVVAGGSSNEALGLHSTVAGG